MLSRAFIAIPLLLCPAAFAADIGLIDWDHCSNVHTDINGIEVWQTDLLAAGPQSPFSGSTGVTIGGTSASASYDFAYSPLGGTFDVSSIQAMTSTGRPFGRRSYVFGGLMLRPDVPVIVDFSGSITATMSLDGSGVGVSFNVDRLDTQTQLFWTGNGRQGFVGTHTWEVAGQFVLQPGVPYGVGYWLTLEGGEYDPAGVLEAAVGQARITLTAVPEPGALSALLLATLALVRRARHIV